MQSTVKKKKQKTISLDALCLKIVEEASQLFFVLVSIVFRFDECKIKSSHGWLASLSKLTPVNYSHT